MSCSRGKERLAPWTPEIVSRSGVPYISPTMRMVSLGDKPQSQVTRKGKDTSSAQAKSDISKGASAVVRRDIPKTKTSVQVDRIGILRPCFNSSHVPGIWISSRMSPVNQRMTLPQMSDFELTHPRTRYHGLLLHAVNFGSNQQRSVFRHTSRREFRRRADT